MLPETPGPLRTFPHEPDHRTHEMNPHAALPSLDGLGTDSPGSAAADNDFPFDDSSFDELRDEAVRRFEALVDRVTDGLMNDPVANGPAHDREACRLAAVALLAEANRAAFGADSLVAQVLRNTNVR